MAMQAVAGSTLVSGSSVVYLSVGGMLLWVVNRLTPLLSIHSN